MHDPSTPPNTDQHAKHHPSEMLSGTKFPLGAKMYINLKMA
jgi:hypothetical protein